MGNLKIKAGSITHLTDARYFAAWQVDYMGFPVIQHPAENEPGIREIKEIASWVEGPLKVGEVRETIDPEFLEFYCEETGMDIIEFRKEVIPTTDWKQNDYPVAFNVNNISEVDQLINDPKLPKAVYYLIDNLSGRVGFKLQDTLLFIRLTEMGSLGGIIENPAIDGIQLRGSAEEKTGIKSFENLDVILEKLRWD